MISRVRLPLRILFGRMIRIASRHVREREPMKAHLFSRIYVAALSAGITCILGSTPAAAQPKDAEPATHQANAAVLKSLPFSDRSNFEEAQRGFIASLPDGIMSADAQRTIWSMKPYAFITGDAPATVNPSLWRQAQLNNFNGLFKVTDRLYQIRGLDDSNITIVESDSGLIVVDTLSAAESAKAAMELYYQNRPRKPVVAVIYTHTHVDHFGGVKGVVSEADVRTGNVNVFALDQFMDYAVADNIVAGNAMFRRSLLVSVRPNPATWRTRPG
jgi:alkyl sulfatase BDS1-like metallo-beta-lactamase superfamily hydrolase